MALRISAHRPATRAGRWAVPFLVFALTCFALYASNADMARHMWEEVSALFDIGLQF